MPAMGALLFVGGRPGDKFGQRGLCPMGMSRFTLALALALALAPAPAVAGLPTDPTPLIAARLPGERSGLHSSRKAWVRGSPITMPLGDDTPIDHCPAAVPAWRRRSRQIVDGDRPDAWQSRESQSRRHNGRDLIPSSTVGRRCSKVLRPGGAGVAVRSGRGRWRSSTW